jgi:hypothetical protein
VSFARRSQRDWHIAMPPYMIVESLRSGVVAPVDEWMSHWTDRVEFEIHPVMTSEEAALCMSPKAQA